jgi:hypothetical protein
LDADVLIQAKNGLYSFEIAPPFWSFLDEQVEAGTIRTSTRIYEEILKWEDSHDRLSRWVKHRRTTGMFVHPQRDVQEVYRQIADRVNERYSERPPKVSEFLRGGDGWIIAHAKCDEGIVVSHESRVDRSSMTPKIPNVCTLFEVECISLREMLQRLKFRFGR